MQQQNWHDIISQFASGQQRVLSVFRELVKTYPTSKRQEALQLMEETADEMEHHGYHSYPYHNDLKEGLRKLFGLSSHTAEALMMSYQLATPATRTKLKKEMEKGSDTRAFSPSFLSHTPSIIHRAILRNKLNQYANKIPSLGKQILRIQTPPGRELTYQDINSHHPLCATFFRLAQLSSDKRQQVIQLILNSQQLTHLSDIDRGVSYLALKLLPFLTSAQQPTKHLPQQNEQAENIKQTYNTVKVFGWCLLTQNPYDQDRWIKLMEMKPQNQFIARDYDFQHC